MARFDKAVGHHPQTMSVSQQGMPSVLGSGEEKSLGRRSVLFCVYIGLRRRSCWRPDLSPNWENNKCEKICKRRKTPEALERTGYCFESSNMF